MRCALEAAAVRVAPSMNAQAVAKRQNVAKRGKRSACFLNRTCCSSRMFFSRRGATGCNEPYILSIRPSLYQGCAGIEMVFFYGGCIVGALGCGEVRSPRARHVHLRPLHRVRFRGARRVRAAHGPRSRQHASVDGALPLGHVGCDDQHDPVLARWRSVPRGRARPRCARAAYSSCSTALRISLAT